MLGIAFQTKGTVCAKAGRPAVSERWISSALEQSGRVIIHTQNGSESRYAWNQLRIDFTLVLEPSQFSESASVLSGPRLGGSWCQVKEIDFSFKCGKPQVDGDSAKGIGPAECKSW